MMNTNQIHKSVAVALGAAAAIGIPMLLGAGTAQAAVDVTANPDALGVSVRVSDAGGSFSGPSASCTYTATPIPQPGKLTPLPASNVPFHLQEGGAYTLWFPGLQTGHDWNVGVWCPTGGLVSTVVTY